MSREKRDEAGQLCQVGAAGGPHLSEWQVDAKSPRARPVGFSGFRGKQIKQSARNLIQAEHGLLLHLKGQVAVREAASPSACFH
jgi:hypothetical protein